jgi:hypothetical protein
LFNYTRIQLGVNTSEIILFKLKTQSSIHLPPERLIQLMLLLPLFKTLPPAPTLSTASIYLYINKIAAHTALTSKNKLHLTKRSDKLLKYN